MKKATLWIVVISVIATLSTQAFGQSDPCKWKKEVKEAMRATDKVDFSKEPCDQTSDSLQKICGERGHVPGRFYQSTLLLDPPAEVVDTRDSSYIIYRHTNIVSYRCQRCDEPIKEKQKNDTIVIWRRSK